MKRFLLLSCFLAPFIANAQSLELGVGGGLSFNGSPGDNMEYKSDQSVANYAATLKLIYTTRSSFQLGLDAHVLELSGKSSKRYEGMPNPYLEYVGGDNKKLVYSKYTVSFCLVGNKAFMFSHNSGYVYFGVAAGYGAARNNSKEYANNEAYKAPDGGHGFVFGGQAGLVKNISENLAFNLDFALRSYNFEYDAEAPLKTPPEKLNYSIMAFPITIGIRYYLFRYDPDAVPRSGGSRPMGRAMY